MQKVTKEYKPGDAVYALYYGPQRDKQPRGVPAVIKKPHGSRCFTVKVVPCGPVWIRHLEQLQPHYVSEKDTEPGEVSNKQTFSSSTAGKKSPTKEETPGGAPTSATGTQEKPSRLGRTKPHPEYGPHNVRRSNRKIKALKRLDLNMLSTN